MSFKFKLMELSDIDEVYEIEKLTNEMPWSKDDFRREVEENAIARYVVGIDTDTEKVVCYGGMWIIFDESHVTNIAVHPDYRGRHLGDEIVLYLMLISSIYFAEKMTLEVRVSNNVAINLYKKWGFFNNGVRKNYYENMEDAYIMWNENISEVLERVKNDGKAFDDISC